MDGKKDFCTFVKQQTQAKPSRASSGEQIHIMKMNASKSLNHRYEAQFSAIQMLKKKIQEGLVFN